MGGPHPREHGAAHSAIFGESSGSPIHRGPLHPLAPSLTKNAQRRTANSGVPFSPGRMTSTHIGPMVFEPPIVEMRDGQMHFRIAIRLGRLHPEFIRVELFARPGVPKAPVRQVMDRSEPLPDGVFVYSASVEGTRPAADYTPRVIPNHPAVQSRLKPRQFAGKSSSPL